MSKREIGQNYHLKGYNCAQAVALAFKEEIGLDEQTIAKTISGFGGGFGRLKEVCGAVSGMVFVLGALKGCDDPSDNAKKLEIYQEVQTLMKEFENQNGSYICRDLVAVPQKRSCNLLVGDACEILENYLNK